MAGHGGKGEWLTVVIAECVNVIKPDRARKAFNYIQQHKGLVDLDDLQRQARRFLKAYGIDGSNLGGTYGFYLG